MFKISNLFNITKKNYININNTKESNIIKLKYNMYTFKNDKSTPSITYKEGLKYKVEVPLIAEGKSICTLPWGKGLPNSIYNNNKRYIDEASLLKVFFGNDKELLIMLNDSYSKNLLGHPGVSMYFGGIVYYLNITSSGSSFYVCINGQIVEVWPIKIGKDIFMAPFPYSYKFLKGENLLNNIFINPIDQYPSLWERYRIEEPYLSMLSEHIKLCIFNKNIVPLDHYIKNGNTIIFYIDNIVDYNFKENLINKELHSKYLDLSNSWKVGKNLIHFYNENF